KYTRFGSVCQGTPILPPAHKPDNAHRPLPKRKPPRDTARWQADTCQQDRICTPERSTGNIKGGLTRWRFFSVRQGMRTRIYIFTPMQKTYPNHVKAWLRAFRLRTLPLAVACIGMGGFLAAEAGAFRLDVFLLCIV